MDETIFRLIDTLCEGVHGSQEESNSMLTFNYQNKLITVTLSKERMYNYYYCIPDTKRGYYGFIIVVVRALVRVRRDFLLATYSPHFFLDFFHIWQVA